MPSIPVLCLPPSHVHPKVLGLNVLIYHSQPSGSWGVRLAKNNYGLILQKAAVFGSVLVLQN